MKLTDYVPMGHSVYHPLPDGHRFGTTGCSPCVGAIITVLSGEVFCAHISQNIAPELSKRGVNLEGYFRQLALAQAGFEKWQKEYAVISREPARFLDVPKSPDAAKGVEAALQAYAARGEQKKKVAMEAESKWQDLVAKGAAALASIFPRPSAVLGVWMVAGGGMSASKWTKECIRRIYGPLVQGDEHCDGIYAERGGAGIHVGWGGDILEGGSAWLGRGCGLMIGDGAVSLEQAQIHSILLHAHT